MLVSLVVIFLPLILDGEGVSELPGDLFSTPPSQIEDPAELRRSDSSKDASEAGEKATQYPLKDPTVHDLMPKEDAANTTAPPEASESAEPTEAGEATEPTPVRKWNVQLATYAQRSLADALAQRLRNDGYTTTVKVESGQSGESLFIVVLLKEGRYDEIERLSRALATQHNDIDGPIIRRRK